MSAQIDQTRWSEKIESIALNQDRAAFAELFEFFAPRIKAFVMSAQNGFIGNELAEEITQEVLLKVWRKAGSYDAKNANVSTWIYTIARNTRIDVLRKHSFEECPLEVDDIWDEQSDEQGPLQTLQQQKAKRLIDEKMKELPDEQRQVIYKSYMEGKSHSEIAEDLNISLGTVKSRIRLAMQKLAMVIDR